LTRYDGGSINQLESIMEHIEAYIRTLPDEAVLIDAQDGEVWLTVSVGRGRASTILTREQAQDLVVALQEVIA
jgi:hypothetical protein